MGGTYTSGISPHPSLPPQGGKEPLLYGDYNIEWQLETTRYPHYFIEASLDELGSDSTLLN